MMQAEDMAACAMLGNPSAGAGDHRGAADPPPLNRALPAHDLDVVAARDRLSLSAQMNFFAPDLIVQLRLVVVFAVLAPLSGFADLITNAPVVIDRRLDVQVIQVARNDGSNPAPLFGSASGQAEIFKGIDQIWAQAGIDVEFKFRLTPFNDTFGLIGSPGNNSPRPTGDLSGIISAALSEGGVLDPNPKVINLFMVQIVPGFSQTSDNTANGLAFTPGNGIALWAGPNLTGFSAGRDVISSVLAHEIGHNLGLSHVTTAQNLMQAGGAADDGERLSSSQIATVRQSSFLVSVPEPRVTLLLTGIAFVLAIRRRR